MLIWLTYRTQKTHSRTWKVLLGWSWDSEKMPKLHSLKWKVVLTLLWRMVSPESSSCKHISSQSRYQKVVVSSISVWLLKGFFTSMQRPGNVCLAQWLGILQVWHWQDPAGFKCTYSWYYLHSLLAFDGLTIAIVPQSSSAKCYSGITTLSSLTITCVLTGLGTHPMGDRLHIGLTQVFSFGSVTRGLATRWACFVCVFTTTPSSEIGFFIDHPLSPGSCSGQVQLPKRSARRYHHRMRQMCSPCSKRVAEMVLPRCFPAHVDLWASIEA